MTNEQQFDFATALILSYDAEGATDDDLPGVLRVINETAPAAFDRILILAAALRRPEHEQYGLVETGVLLRSFEPTRDLESDVQRFLDLMRRADEALLTEVKERTTIQTQEVNEQ